jgi:hypothetical protein
MWHWGQDVGILLSGGWKSATIVPIKVNDCLFGEGHLVGSIPVESMLAWDDWINNDIHSMYE